MWSRGVLKPEDSGPAAPFDERLRRAQQLFLGGGFAEAAALFRGLAEERPRKVRLWTILAQCFEALGDEPAELAACGRAIELDPTLVRARQRAAGILGERGEIAAAADHMQAVSDQLPHLSMPALRLARLRQALGEAEGETAAWIRVLAVEPDQVEAHSRLAELYWRAGQTQIAAPHLKRIVAAFPSKRKFWERLAHCYEEAGDLEAAEATWARVLELDPSDVHASERLAKVRLFQGLAPAAGRRTPAMRLAVLGNCQAYAMARCIRALNPDVEIVSVSWAELKSDEQVQRLISSLEGLDAVLAQPVNDPRLAGLHPKVLIRRPTPCAFFPAVHFTGFHPDALLGPGRAGLGSLIGEWHSALILAGYLRGLPPERTEALFNAYVYGVLGYLDEYAKAEQFLRLRAEQIEWDLGPDLGAWRAASPFVHVPNHPKIEVMMSLARQVCINSGLEFDAAAATPADPFDRFGDWPIYPELGKRLGVPGEMVFVSPVEQDRAFDLLGAIRWFYAGYAKAPPETLRFARVDQVIERLRAEGI